MKNRTVELQSVTFSHGKFSISAEEAKDIAIGEIRSFFGIHEGLYLRSKDGMIVYDEWNHNYCDEKEVRKASKMDKQVLEVLKEMNKSGYVSESE